MTRTKGAPSLHSQSLRTSEQMPFCHTGLEMAGRSWAGIPSEKMKLWFSGDAATDQASKLADKLM